MMMKTPILLLLPALAWAAQPVNSTAYSHSHAQSSSTAISGAAAISGGNAFSGGSVKIDGDSTYFAVAPSIAPTAPCMGASSAGGAGSGFGLSFGSSWTDDDCNTRETARLMHTMGLRLDAVAVLCSSKYARAAPSCAKFRPAECHADEVVAKRLGVDVCK